MDAISIKTISTGGLGESIITVAQLDREPTADWAQTFERSAKPALYGQHPYLEGDRVTVVSGRDHACDAGYATRLAVALTNELVIDHEKER